MAVFVKDMWSFDVFDRLGLVALSGGDDSVLVRGVRAWMEEMLPG